jgi:signal transduction histidine kinase
VDYERERLLNAAESALSDGGWHGEMCFKHFETGAEIPMLHHMFVIRQPETGAPMTLATISSDMSDRRRAEEALRVAKEELARVNRVLTMGELVGSIAHEVSQPLTAVVTNAGACVRWLAAHPPNLAEARAAAESIKHDGTRASQVIQKIRALLAGGEPKYSTILLNDTIREAIFLVEPEARSRDVKVKLAIAPGLPPVRGDRILLQQVILNLSLNAIEAMKSISDRARVLEIGAELASTREVLVSVRDSGPGLPAENRERVFDAFYTTKVEGMGMGLAICRSIVDAHGGRLWSRANQEWGETFSFTFPMAEEAAP